ncbi:MAG: metallophosphoesterase, partial [Rhodobacteraceae bacterium]|nr:metallophosphoesterase [Paracoccaceae bacterium]
MPPKPVPLVANMRILATTDVHMQLTGRDDRLSLTHTDRGLARLATLIDQQRQTARGTTLLFDNGDFLQGAAMADALYDAQSDITHPLGPIMSDLAYDAVGLGNHDFDFGIPYLRRFTDALPCPVLCANLECSDLPAIAPFTVLEHKVRAEDGSHHVIRIGVVSALPQQTAIWNARFLAGCATLSDPVLAIQTISKTLRCDHGADLIIALSHGGITVDCGLPNQEHFAADVARIEEVDVVIAGHQHKLFPDPSFRNLPDTDIQDSTIAGTPCVMPGFGGSHLGQIDLHLQQNDDGWIIF